MQKIAELELEHGNAMKAIKLVNQGMEVVKTLNSPKDEMEFYRIKAEEHYSEDNYREAKVWIDKALNIAKDAGTFNVRFKIYELANQVYKNLALYKQAYQWQSLCMLIYGYLLFQVCRIASGMKKIQESLPGWNFKVS